MENILLLFITISLAFVLLVMVIPHRNRAALLTEILLAWNAWRKLTTLYTERGGYVHDTSMSLFIPPADMLKTAGTWTDTVGGVANTYMQRRTAADATAIIVIPIAIPQNSVALKGGYIKSIDIWYNVTTAAMDAVTALLTRATLPATGAAFGAVAAPAFTYDTGHDTAAERLTLDEHKMTLTITTPFWLDDDDELYVELTIDAAATSLFDLYGARANYTFRA
jgi:hypothetical protein